MLPDAGALQQLVLDAAQPVVAAGNQAHHVEEAVQKPPPRLAPRRRRCGRHQGLRLQLLQAVAQRVFLLAEQLDAAPQQQRRQRGAGDREEEKVGQHAILIPRMLAILRMTRMPTISEMMA